MHESGIGPYGLRNRPSAKRKTVCAPLTRDRLTIRSGLRCGCKPRASPKARQSSASSVVLTRPRPAPWPRSQPGRHRAGGARRTAGSAISGGIFWPPSAPQSLGEAGGPSVGLLGPHRLVRVRAGQDPDSKSGKKSGADR